MNSLAVSDLKRQPRALDLREDVYELLVDSTNYSGAEIAFSTTPIMGVKKIELVQAFVSGVALTASLPTYAWYDFVLKGLPSNRLSAAHSSMRIPNLGERSYYEYTARPVYESYNDRGYNLTNIQISVRRPDGVQATSADLGAVSFLFRVTIVGGNRL